MPLQRQSPRNLGSERLNRFGPVGHCGNLLDAPHQRDVASLQGDCDCPDHGVERRLVSLPELVIDLEGTVKRALVRPAEGIGERGPSRRDVAFGIEVETRDDLTDLLLVTEARLEPVNGTPDRGFVEHPSIANAIRASSSLSAFSGSSGAFASIDTARTCRSIESSSRSACAATGRETLSANAPAASRQKSMYRSATALPSKRRSRDAVCCCSSR